MSAEQRRVTALILAVLLLHVVPVAREVTGGRETLWPFLTWGMFRHSSRPPVEATHIRVLAVTPGGERVVGPTDAGFDRFAFRRYYTRPIAAGDAAAARDLARRIGRRWGVAIESIVADETVFSVGPDGLRRRAGSRRVFDPRVDGEPLP